MLSNAQLLQLVRDIRHGQYTGTGFKPDGWKFVRTEAECMDLVRKAVSKGEHTIDVDYMHHDRDASTTINPPKL